jgi:hypothetical protein
MKIIVALICLALFGALGACDAPRSPRSSSGVSKATARVQTNAEGLTVEQINVRDRLKADNTPGSIKHLYVISPYSGQVLIYSTVRGKVTSGGKRLTPNTITSNPGEGYCNSGFDIEIGGSRRCTDEVLQDDGSYGSSGEYIFWFDTRGIYHQHPVTGGQIIHVSSEPLAVKGVIINMELTVAEAAKEETVPVDVVAAGKSKK